MFSSTLFSLTVFTFLCASTEGRHVPSRPLKEEFSAPLVTLSRRDLSNDPVTTNATGPPPYAVIVHLGSPPSPFKLLVDTSSGDTWVPSSKCSGNVMCPPAFVNVSTTLVTNNTIDWGAEYNVSGIGAKDTLNFGGIQLPGFQFGLADQSTQTFTSFSYDGVMGVAGIALSQTGFSNPVVALNQAGLVPSAVLTYHGGNVSIGASTDLDPASTVSWNNTDPNGLWAGISQGVSVNNQPTFTSPKSVLFDTGSSFMVMPLADAAAIHALIPGTVPAPNNTGYSIIPCLTPTTLALNFQGKQFTLDGPDLAYLPINPNQPNASCYSAIVGALLPDDTWVAGKTFFNKFHFETNFNLNQITLSSL